MRTFAVTPGAHTLATLLQSLIKLDEEARLTSFSGSRLRQLRGLGVAGANLDVVEFGKIVAEVVEVRGGPGGFLPSAGLIEAAIEEACSNMTEGDPLFKVAGLGGAHRVIAKNWDLLRTFGVDLDSLQADEKQQSVARILGDAQAMLQQLGRRFNSEAMAACAELEAEPIPFARVICVAASEFRPLELEWLRWLSTQGVAIDIIVESHASQPDFFLASGQTAAKFEQPRPFLAGNALSATLFSKEPSEHTEFEVSVFDCPDELLESEWVLRSVAERVSNQDWNGVAIFCRGLEKYGPILEAAAIRLGVPLTLSRQMPLLSTATAKIMLAMLTAVSSGDVRALAGFLRFARTPDADLAEALNAEKLITEACRAAVSEPDPWATVSAWLNTQETPIPWLRALLDWRAEYSAATNLASWRERLIELARNEAIHAILASDANDSREGNAVTALLRTLAQTASIDRLRSRRELSLSGFVSACRRLWKEGSVNIEGIPGGVTVVSSAEAIGLVDHLYVMGTVEGVFPRRRQEDPLFSDADLTQITGSDPLPNSFDRARFEREEFYRACCSATAGLTFTYPRSEGEQGSVSAFYLEEVFKAVGKNKDSIRRISPRDLFPKEPILEADLELQQAFIETTKPMPIEISGAAQTIIRSDPEIPMGVQELNRALVCPFRWFAKDGLNLQPKRDLFRWSRLMKIPAEVNLVGISDAETARNVLNDAAEMKLSELYGEATSHDLSLMRAGVKRLIAEWTEREFVAREAWGTAENISRDSTSGRAPFRSKIKLPNGRFIELRFDAPLVSQRGTFDVAHLYMSRDPIEQSKHKGPEAPAWSFAEQDSLKILALLLMRSDRTRGTAVEIDHRDGRRFVHFPPAGLPARRIENVIPHALESKQDLLNEFTVKLQEAVAILTEPTITPKPGQACDFCDFGELCRRHIQFPEDSGDPFESSEASIV